MPIIGSISGSFGYGRSPQTAPPPGFILYPPIGSLKTWYFASNGTFSFGANAVTNTLGNCYVLTPTASFIANVKIWGAGGGGGNSMVDSAVINSAGAGGATYGQMLFQAGQPYTVFTGGAGIPFLNRSPKSGGGGAAAGILLGNVFSESGTLDPEVIAGGGGGATRQTDPYPWPIAGAGGGSIGQPGDRFLGSSALAPTTGAGDLLLPKSGPPQTGLPTWDRGYYGGGGLDSNGQFGGGGGGYRGGNYESGGRGFVSLTQPSLTTISGNYSIPALYDDSSRGLAGDSDRGGFITIFMDEYKVANIVASGGTVTDVPIPGFELAYRYHSFTSNGKFTVNSASITDTIDIFAVGAGGGGDAVGAGGGGGGVALRNSFPISAGNYLIDVGTGGSTSDAYSTAKVGGVFGGYRGTDSAFYTNPLAAKFIPDSYWRLINSFGAKIRYISAAGDGTNGLSLTTAYTTIEAALAANVNDVDRIVFVVLGGTYDPVFGPNIAQTPINDGKKPRIFVCAPGKVTINFSPADASADRDSPMALLQHPQSAIYGATFVRNMFDVSDSISQAAFFNNSTNPPGSALRHAGSFYNCVFKENAGQWALVYDPLRSASFRVENCTFSTKADGLDLSTVNSSNANQVLFKSCVFSKEPNTNAILDNCATGVTIGAKYVVTAVTDKGVYSGEYGWGAKLTVPEKTAKSFVMVAQGGAGGGGIIGSIAYPHNVGGNGGGSGGADGPTDLRSPSSQYNAVLNLEYSAYGWPGGATTGAYKSGGGGAQYPGLDAFTENTSGGVGIEWPRDSGMYYGTGGDAMGAARINQVAPGNAGRGGRGGTEGDVNGYDGFVAVRYIVPGPYTQPVPRGNVNLIAYGGQITTTATYRQHIFTSSGRFIMLNVPEGMFLDIITIGGGGGGSGNGHYDYSNPGEPGSVGYSRNLVQVPGQLTITIGGGGGQGTYHEGVNGQYGGSTSANGAGITQFSSGGEGGRSSYYGNWYGLRYPTEGTLITEGLYSDNTTSYAQRPGSGYPYRANTDNWGTPGSGGRGANYGWDDPGNRGLSGAVIIRYPIYPTS